MRRLMYIFLCILVSISCEHKELCYDHSHTIDVNISFDWANAPDAAPKSMSLYLFSEDGTNPRRYEFVGREGGIIRVVPGVYHAICLNSDTETIRHRYTDLHHTYTLTTDQVSLLSGMAAFGVFTRSEPPMAKGTEDESVISPSEMLWSHQMTYVELSEHGQKFVMSPEVSYNHIHLEILNAENLKYTTAVSGTLSGLADGYRIGTGELSAGLATIPFSLSITGDRDQLNGDFYTFGHCPADLNKHILTVYAVLHDGTQWYHSFDVTDQMHESEDHIIRITLDRLPIPEPGPGTGGEGGGGFVPEVGEWKQIDITITM